ncbi:MAG: type II secretion system F family protein [Candidatus Pacebacteria bacterium]|nr:type II secretion system F family protein [Candidatus Paceibacterota bacterium]
MSYFFYVNSTPAGKAYIDYIKLKIPILNKLLNKLYISRFATNLNTMLSSGISMVEALNITSEVVDNYVYKKMIERILARVENGKSLSSSMSEETLMPNIMIQMTRIGEETGSIGPMLSSIADFYTKELERTIDTTISLIEPLMVVVMGVAVAGLMAAVLLPLYNITSSIS